MLCVWVKSSQNLASSVSKQDESPLLDSASRWFIPINARLESARNAASADIRVRHERVAALLDDVDAGRHGVAADGPLPRHLARRAHPGPRLVHAANVRPEHHESPQNLAHRYGITATWKQQVPRLHPKS